MKHDWINQMQKLNRPQNVTKFSEQKEKKKAQYFCNYNIVSTSVKKN